MSDSKAKSDVCLWWSDNPKVLFKYYLYKLWPWSRFQRYNSWLYSFQKAVDSLRSETELLRMQRDYLAQRCVDTCAPYNGKEITLDVVLKDAILYAAKRLMAEKVKNGSKNVNL